MKRILYLFIFGLINLSFIRPENKPVYKINISSTDCYFEVLINHKSIYKNETQYKLSRKLDILKFIEKKDTQQIESVIYHRHTTNELTNKSKFNLFITKHFNSKIDTIYISKFNIIGTEMENGKIKYPGRIREISFFLLN